MTDFIRAHWPELLAAWLGVSILAGIAWSRLKALSRDWHEAER